MTSIFASAHVRGPRPAGVKVIAWICFALSGYVLLLGMLVALGQLSLASGAYLLGEYSTMGPALYVLVSIGLTLIAVGLLRGWNWSRRFAVVAAAFLLATAVLPVSAAVIYFQPLGIVLYGGKIIAAIIAIRYLLLSETVDYFDSSRSAGKASHQPQDE